MSFSSGVFLMLFLPIVFILYFNPVTKSVAYKNTVLLIASLFFYAWGEPIFFFVMIASVVIDWWLGIKIFQEQNAGKKKFLMITAVTIHLGILFVFKYLTFVCEQLGLLFHISNTLNIALPIGISFFTFQMMSYIFDIYYKKIECQRSVANLTLYITMFPQLIAGPIVRYQTVASEITQRHVSVHDFYTGITRFIIGLSKKVLLADTLGLIAENIFSAQATMGIPALSAWIGAIAYTLEIYFDFSGYSDMAIGIAGCFGFHFDENFNYPYAATSITEFWKRWHISLTGWFRDYVYIPLGGNRVSKKRHIFNLTAVWLLTGIWHGANWTFVLWGIVYLFFQLLEKYAGKVIFKIPAAIRWLLTMIIVTCNWVLFKSDSVKQAGSYLYTMFGGKEILADETAIYYAQQGARLIVVAFLLCLPWKNIVHYLNGKFTAHGVATKHLFRRMSGLLRIVKDLMLLVLLLISIFCIINGAYSPFIYFNF